LDVRFLFRFFIFVILIVTLACGSNSNIVVNEPNNSGEDNNNASNNDNSENESEESSDDSTEVQVSVGTSRSNPASEGSKVTTDGMEFVIVSSIRPANDIVMEGNTYNTEPEDGQEYIFIELQVKCIESSDEQCSVNLYNLKLVGSAGVERDAEWFITGVENLLEDTDFYGGTTIRGFIPFIVNQDEVDLILVYEPLFEDTFYLAVPGEDFIYTEEESSESQEAEEPSDSSAPVGTARSNPAPVGSVITADDMEFEILSYVRPATDIVMGGNMFNTEPESGEEYILVELEIKCMKSSDDQCSIGTYNLKLIGSTGIERDAEWFVSGVDNLLEQTEFYGGASISGLLPFILNTDEVNVLLVYEPLFGDEFYLSLD
jgi:hypothetical protein